MTANKNDLTTYAQKEISLVTQNYIDWLKTETGYDVDPLSVQLSSNLRGVFQKSAGNQKRIAEAAARNAAEREARAQRIAERAANPVAPKPGAQATPKRTTAAKPATEKAGK